MRRIFGNWLQWGFKGGHLGFHKTGNCWKFNLSISKYNTCTYYNFWRFYICFDKKDKK